MAKVFAASDGANLPEHRREWTGAIMDENSASISSQLEAGSAQASLICSRSYAAFLAR